MWENAEKLAFFSKDVFTIVFSQGNWRTLATYTGKDYLRDF